MRDVTSMSDFELIQACLNEDKSYFGELVGRYKNLVFTVILRMLNDRQEANDLSQEVFIKIYLNLDKYHPDFKFSTWIMRIATNHVIDFRRKKHQETVPLENVEYELSGEESPEDAYITNERKRFLTNMIEGLPDMYKIPIVLYHQQGMSYQEISEITHEPLSKVKNRIFRGRKMLKENIMSVKDGRFYAM